MVKTFPEGANRSPVESEDLLAPSGKVCGCAQLCPHPRNGYNGAIMRTLIFSDIHDNLFSLERLLALRDELAADRLICLGDVGHHPAIFDLLAQHDVACTFGNWEVSGLGRMPLSLAVQVGLWPATLRHETALFCHATPDMDPAHDTTAATAAAMQRLALGWHTVFPRMDRSEEARWSALAALEAEDLRVAFHGHTHIQLAWAWLPTDDGRRMIRRIPPTEDVTELPLHPGTPDTPARYLIGVGSIGAPDDGPWPRFAVYDDEAQIVSLHRLPK